MNERLFLCNNDFAKVSWSPFTCDVAVFSPPYKTSDGYTPQLMKNVGVVLRRVMMKDSWAFMVFGQLS